MLCSRSQLLDGTAAAGTGAYMTQIDYSVGGELATSGIASEIDAEALYDKCMVLAHNLWLSWQPEVTN